MLFEQGKDYAILSAIIKADKIRCVSGYDLWADNITNSRANSHVYFHALMALFEKLYHLVPVSISVSTLIKEHALLNLDDVFDGENYAGTGTLRDDITDGILSSTKCAPYGDGEIYLAPFSSGPQGLIYNKTFFDENNLEVPKTWDEFFTLGDTLKDIDGRALFTYQGIYPGYMEEMLWPAIANECGEEALTKIANYEEGSFNNEGVLKALTHIKEIAEKGYLLEGTVGMNHTESQTEMMLGKAAFITNGTWMENEMQDAPREEGFEFAISLIWVRAFNTPSLLKEPSS